MKKDPGRPDLSRARPERGLAPERSRCLVPVPAPTTGREGPGMGTATVFRIGVFDSCRTAENPVPEHCRLVFYEHTRHLEDSEPVPFPALPGSPLNLLSVLSVCSVVEIRSRRTGRSGGDLSSSSSSSSPPRSRPRSVRRRCPRFEKSMPRSSRGRTRPRRRRPRRGRRSRPARSRRPRIGRRIRRKLGAHARLREKSRVAFYSILRADSSGRFGISILDGDVWRGMMVAESRIVRPADRPGPAVAAARRP